MARGFTGTAATEITEVQNSTAHLIEITTTDKIEVSAGSFVVGNYYSISSVGTTDWVAIGAESGIIGEQFKATGAGSGSGKAVNNEIHYLTDYNRDISWDNGNGSNNYLAMGHFLSIGDVKESSDIRVNDLDISLSAVDQVFLQEFLANEFIDQPVHLHKVFIKARGILDGSVVGVLKNMFSGTTNSMNISEDPDSGESTIKGSASNHFANFNRTSGRHTTSSEQDIHFPGQGDEGFHFCGNTGKGLMQRWGKD